MTPRDPWGLLDALDAAERRAAEREAAAERRHAELIAAIEASANGDAATIDNESAAKLAGFPTVDALRVAAGRRPELQAARVGRGRWGRAKLIAVVAARGGR